MLVSTAPPVKYSLTGLTAFGLFIVLFGFFGILTWAATAGLNSAIVTQGIVKVDTENKRVQHLEGGIIQSILVKDGDYVSKGQVLIKLDETIAKTEQARVEAQLLELKVRRELFLAQRNQKEALVFDPLQYDLSRYPELEEKIASAQQRFALGKELLSSELNILSSKAEQLEEQANGVRSERKAKEEQLAALREEVDAWEKLVQQKLADKIRYLELKREVSKVSGDSAKLGSDLAGVQAQLKEVELEKFRVKQAYQEKAANELTDIEAQIGDLEKRFDAAQAVLERVEVKAPVSGLVVGMQIHTVGAVIKSGDTLLELVPEQDELIIETKVKPVDIDKVYAGMDARVKLSSYKAHELREFNGLVDSVSADAFEDPKTLEMFYKARVLIPADSVLDLENKKFQSGMPAEVFIQTGESTPLQYLLDPLFNAFNRAWRES